MDDTGPNGPEWQIRVEGDGVWLHWPASERSINLGSEDAVFAAWSEALSQRDARPTDPPEWVQTSDSPADRRYQEIDETNFGIDPDLS